MPSIPLLSRRVAVYNSSGDFLVFYAPKTEAQRLILDGLAIAHDARQVRLTCHPTHGVGQSLPQYHDGRTMMLGKYQPRYGSFTRW